MAALHAQMHQIQAPEGLFPAQKEAYSQKILQTSLDDETKQKLLAQLEALSDPDAASVCHGDFHPMNILFHGHRPVVIDWAFAARGDPCADAAGTYLITRLLACASAAHNPWEQLLYQAFTPIFAEVYLREYLHLTDKTRQEILQWTAIRAATYLDLGLPDTANQKLRELCIG